MGCFSSLIVTLNCSSCSTPFRTDLQFRSGNDADMPEYTEGASVTSQETFPAGASFEATAFYYCNTCLKKWTTDRLRAFQTVLDASLRWKVLTPSQEPDSIPAMLPQVTLLGVGPLDRPTIDGTLDLYAWLRREKRGVSIHPNVLSDEPKTTLEDLYPYLSTLLEGVMLGQGWPYGTKFNSSNYRVYVTPERTLKYEAVVGTA